MKSKRKEILVKYSDIIHPKYCYFKLLPSSSISNYDSSSLSLLVHELFKTLKNRIHIFEKRLFLEDKTSIRYLIDISKENVEFFYVIPDIYKNLAIDTIAKIWNGRCTVQEIPKESIRVLESPTLYQLKYKYEDSLSIETKKTSNKFLSKALSVIEIMEEDDNVQLIVNLVPYETNTATWKTFCDDIYDRYKKNLPIDKNKVNFNFVFNILISSIGGLINLLLPEALRSTVDFSIAGDKKELSNSSLEKSKDGRVIIESQIAVLSKSTNRKKEDTLASSLCKSFKEVKGDNELIGYKTSFKKSNVSIHKANWNICTNKTSADELSNVITIAGKGILNKYTNIEHVASKQVQLIDELSTGIVVLGTQTYKNKSRTLYLNENKEYANLPILILTKMGGGKSTWFENVGVSLMNNYRNSLNSKNIAKKESFLVLDYIKQNELSYNIMNNISPEDTIMIDLSTLEGTSLLGFSFLEAEYFKDDFRKRLKSASRQGKEMMKLIDYLNEDTSDPLTTPMKRYLNSAFAVCYIHPNKSLRDSIRIIENYDIRHEYIDMVPEELKDYLDDEIRALKELDDKDNGTKINLISGIISRTYTLQSNPILKEMYNAKPEDGINLADEMQNGKGIFILMPDDEFDSEMINIISTYIVSRLFFACKKRGTLNKNDVTRCTLLIDELNLAEGCLSTLNDIIGQLRKYKLRPIISAHNLKQISLLKTNLMSVGLSVILPQGTLEGNFEEFENFFKKEGFSVEDLQTLKEYETLNLIETSQGKKAFISKFPPPVKGKIEDRDDISIGEFKEIVRGRLKKYNPTISKSGSDDLNERLDYIDRYVSVSSIDESTDINKTEIESQQANINNESNLQIDLKDLNDDKFDYLFDKDSFSDNDSDDDIDYFDL